MLMPNWQETNFSAGAEKKLIVSDDEASCLRLGQLSKDIAKVVAGTCPEDLYLRVSLPSECHGIID